MRPIPLCADSPHSKQQICVCNDANDGHRVPANHAILMICLSDPLTTDSLFTHSSRSNAVINRYHNIGHHLFHWAFAKSCNQEFSIRNNGNCDECAWYIWGMCWCSGPNIVSKINLAETLLSFALPNP